MPGGGKLRYFKERKELFAKYRNLISTLKMVTLARYRQALPRIQTRDHSMTFTRKAFDDAAAVETTTPEDQKVLYVPITTNRGSCGPLNSNMVRHLENTINDKDVILAVGKKGQDALVKVIPQHYTRAVINDMKQAISFQYASSIAEHMKSYQYDKAVILFTRYVSAAAQRMSEFEIPNFDAWVARVKKSAGEFKNTTEGDGEPNNYQYFNALLEREGEFLRDYYDFQVAMSVLHAVTDNELSEYASRIVAVENQLANITGLMQEADYKYNKTRKENITAELLEIISTMSALKRPVSAIPKTKFYSQKVQ
jgi:F-type H+-transporting ATPase subunit gamma